MAYTTINKSTDYFNTVLYTGTEPSNKAVTGVGFQPDWVWIKQRSGTEGHYLADVIRGSTYVIRSNETAVENNRGSNGIQSFNSDGFTAGGGDDINSSGGTFASWNWKANGAGSANTAGTINSTVSVNTTAGFSIVSYTGTGANATVGHGLSVAPSLIILKNRTSAKQWQILHHKNTAAPATQQLEFYTDATATVTSQWNSVMPTNTVFSIGTNNATNESGESIIAYCFAEKTGYSKFGSYTGNGSSSNFIYTGFKPAFVMTKCTSNAGESWLIQDSKRIGYNGITHGLLANSSAVEASETYQEIDFLSNGFNWKGTDTRVNANNYTYIYMAFAEAPLVGSNNVPATAR